MYNNERENEILRHIQQKEEQLESFKQVRREATFAQLKELGISMEELGLSVEAQEALLEYASGLLFPFSSIMSPIVGEVWSALPEHQIVFQGAYSDGVEQRRLYQEIYDHYRIPPPSNLVLTESLQAEYLDQSNGFRYLFLTDIRWLGNVNPISLLAGDHMVREVGTATIEICDELLHECRARFGDTADAIQLKVFTNKGDGLCVLAGPNGKQYMNTPEFESMFSFLQSEQASFYEKLEERLSKTRSLFVSNVTDPDFEQIGYDKKTFRSIYWSQPRIKMESEADHEAKKEASFEFMEPQELLRVLYKYRPQLRSVLSELTDRQIDYSESENWKNLFHLLDTMAFDHTTRDVWLELEKREPDKFWCFFHRIEDLAAFIVDTFPGMRLTVRLEEYIRALKLINLESYARGDRFIGDTIQTATEQTTFMHNGHSFSVNFRRWANILNVIPGGRVIPATPLRAEIFYPEGIEREMHLPIVPVVSSSYIIQEDADTVMSNPEPALQDVFRQLTRREREIMVNNSDLSITALAGFVQSPQFIRWDEPSRQFYLDRVFDPADKRGAMTLNRLMRRMSGILTAPDSDLNPVQQKLREILYRVWPYAQIFSNNNSDFTAEHVVAAIQDLYKVRYEWDGGINHFELIITVLLSCVPTKKNH